MKRGKYIKAGNVVFNLYSVVCIVRERLYSYHLYVSDGDSIFMPPTLSVSHIEELMSDEYIKKHFVSFKTRPSSEQCVYFNKHNVYACVSENDIQLVNGNKIMKLTCIGDYFTMENRRNVIRQLQDYLVSNNK